MEFLQLEFLTLPHMPLVEQTNSPGPVSQHCLNKCFCQSDQDAQINRFYFYFHFDLKSTCK